MWTKRHRQKYAEIEKKLSSDDRKFLKWALGYSYLKGYDDGSRKRVVVHRRERDERGLLERVGDFILGE